MPHRRPSPTPSPSTPQPPAPLPARPGSVLDQARAAFDWLTVGPHPVTLDVRAIPGLPGRRLRLDELCGWLRERGCRPATRDAAWSLLVGRARTEAGVWTIACVGCALPDLVRASHRLRRGLPPTYPARRLPGDRTRIALAGVPDHGTVSPAGRRPAAPAGSTAGSDSWIRLTPAQSPHRPPAGWMPGGAGDIEAALLVGFLDELAVVDLNRRHVLQRLLSAAHEAATLAGREALRAPIPHARLFTAAPVVLAGHPDLVLARAVAAGAITRGEAALIGSTRLEPVSLAEVAVRRGQPYRDVRAARIRAERKLSVYLRNTDPDPLHPLAHSSSGGTSEAPRRRQVGRPRRDRPGPGTPAPTPAAIPVSPTAPAVPPADRAGTVGGTRQPTASTGRRQAQVRRRRPRGHRPGPPRTPSPIRPVAPSPVSGTATAFVHRSTVVADTDPGARS